MIRPEDKPCQYATFRVADLFLGIDVRKVQELIRHQEMIAIPLAPPAVEGLINLRGQIVIAIDTRRSLGLPRAEGEDVRVNIVVKSNDAVISLLVDEICDVLDIPSSTRASLPDNMPVEQKRLIECVFHVRQGLILVLDTDRLFEFACS